MEEIKLNPDVVILKNGPIKISGPILLTESNGVVSEVNTKGSVYLCRCGASKNKPFCDGTHKTIDFKD